MLQQCFGRSSAQNRGLGGRCQAQERRTPAAVPTVVRVRNLARTAKTEQFLPDIYIILSSRGICVVYLGCAHAHVLPIGDTCTELAQGPWGIGCVWKVVMTVRPNGMTRNNEERSWAPRRFPWHRAIWSTTSPRSTALSHRIMYIPCRAVMAPWLLRNSWCSERALQLFLCFF